MLSLYRRLIDLRRTEAALSMGSCEAVTADQAAFSFLRQYGTRRLGVALNLTPDPREIDLSRLKTAGRVLLSTHLDREGESVGDLLRLRADEGVIFELNDGSTD